ncbi:MAG: acyl carrier protein [Bacteroidetes bacterium]|nr:acyl carrier protein [Bacteroidota bacterium]
MIEKRKMTLNERVYTVAEKLAPPFVLQFIIKGTGVIEPVKMREAVAKLAEKLPVMRLQLVGRTWHFDGPLPEVISHEGPIPEDFSDSIFKKPLDPFSGRCMEIHLFHGENTSVLFRILHSIVDGKGAQLVLTSLFSMLRGDEIDINPGFISDIEVRKKLASPAHGEREGYGFKWPCFSLSENNHNGFVSGTILFPKRIEAPLAKCAVWFANRFNQSARMLIPVDLRRHEVVENMAANLSLPIYLKIDPGQTWNEVQGNLLGALAENKELAAESMENFGLFAPDFVLEGLMKYVIKQAGRKNRYPMSGFLSDVGVWDLETISTSDFEANDVITLPVFVPLAPFSVNVLHHSGGTRMSVSVPDHIDVFSLLEEIEEHILAEESALKSVGATVETRLIASLQDHPLFPELQQIWSEILELPIEKINSETTFHQLGGDSIKLLFMLSEVSDEYIDGPASTFMSKALNTGGHINIRSLIDIIESFRPENL